MGQSNALIGQQKDQLFDALSQSEYAFEEKKTSPANEDGEYICRIEFRLAALPRDDYFAQIGAKIDGIVTDLRDLGYDAVLAGVSPGGKDDEGVQKARVDVTLYSQEPLI